MTEKSYQRMSEYIRCSKTRYILFKSLYVFLPVVTFATYSLIALWLFLSRDERIYRYILVPLAVFIIVSIIRKIINRQRPYSVMNYKPLINKGKAGESMPSRHELSVAIIAMACFYINFYVGFVLVFVSILIGILRVVSGVHYISDVIVAALIGYGAGFILFFMF